MRSSANSRSDGQRAAARSHVDDAAIFTAITATRSPRWRVQSLFSASKLVVAGAIVALFGGFLLAGVLTTQPEETRPAVGATTTPESTTTPPIELPAEIPEGIESGTLETPLGPARWVHLSGDERAMPPQLSGLISTPDGYAVPEWGDRWFDDGDAQLWRSSDLIDWTSEPLGIEARFGELSRAADTYWLNVA